MRQFLIASFLLFSLLADENMDTGEFRLGSVVNAQTSKNAYFNRLRLPNVYVGTQCPKEGECWSVIRDQSGRTLRSFSPSDNVSTIAQGRYDSVAYLYYAHTFGSEKNRRTQYHLVDQNFNHYRTPGGSTAMASIISKNGDLISIHKFGVYKNGSLTLKNKAVQTVSIANNPQGDIAIAAILQASDEVIVTNLSAWKHTGIRLSKHGDRTGVLSVYPKDSNNVHTTVYKNVNIYNKGLMGAHVDFATDEVKKGWIFNSENRNIGFDPSLYIDANTLHIGATDSTNRQNVSILISSDEYQDLGKKHPKHIAGFENESIIDLLVGVGVSQTYWKASSSIDDIDSDLEFGEVEYDIGRSLYTSIYFEGRYASTHLSLSYLQNRAEAIGGVAGNVSKILNLLIDFDGLIGDSTSLRLKALKGNINGVATFIDKSNGATPITPDGEKIGFKSELITYGGYLMMERGFFAGLEYSEYTTPSAIGFSDASKHISLYGLDPNFEINTYALVIGYDELSYAKRYEVDLSRFYLQALGGFGWADYTLSSEAEEAVRLKEPTKTINYTGTFAFNGELEVGYIFQQRFKAARGLGYAFTAGYRVKGVYTDVGQAKDDGENDVYIEANELELEMSRYDLWHGPFVTANIAW